jgi:hypothetical protein
MTKCTMKFDLAGWSAFYKHAEGEGVIDCDNGQEAKVKITVKGGGLTVGESRLLDATGTFSEVKDIEETFGSYAAVGAEAGAVKSSEAMALTKGEVSLAIAGTGQGSRPRDLGHEVHHQEEVAPSLASRVGWALEAARSRSRSR